MIIYVRKGCIEVNGEEYQTMSDYAKENKLKSVNVVSNWIRRGKIDCIIIEEFNNIKLVPKVVKCKCKRPVFTREVGSGFEPECARCGRELFSCESKG